MNNLKYTKPYTNFILLKKYHTFSQISFYKCAYLQKLDYIRTFSQIISVIVILGIIYNSRKI